MDAASAAGRDAPAVSPTRWARNGDTSIAYRSVGAGAVDLVFLGGTISHVEAVLEEPGVLRFFSRLGQTARVVLVDRRGSGLSDAIGAEGLTEDGEVADVEAVLDALGVDRAVLMGYTNGGAQAMAFAARRPERTLALVLYAPLVRNVRDGAIDWASTADERAARLAVQTAQWGTGENLRHLAPSVADDVRMQAWLARLERQAMTPSGLERSSRMLADMDVRDAHDTAIRRVLDDYGGQEVKTIGDAFLATFTGPPSQAVRCAAAVVDAMAGLGLEVRTGLHTGECERIGGDVGGMAVHIAARVSALAEGGQVLVSGTVYGTVVGSGLSFEDLGMHPLKGVPGQWPLFRLAR